MSCSAGKGFSLWGAMHFGLQPRSSRVVEWDSGFSVGAACSRDATVAFAETGDSMAESVCFAVIPTHAPALVAARGRAIS